MCLDPSLGPWNHLAHQGYIALSEPMSKTDEQGSSLGLFPTSFSLYPHFNRPSRHWPCVKPCLVGDIGKYQRGPKVFLALLDACRLWLCNRTDLKNGLVPHSYFGGTYDKYRGLTTLSGAALRVRLHKAESYITLLHSLFHHIDMQKKVLLRTIRGHLLQVWVSLTVLTNSSK